MLYYLKNAFVQIDEPAGIIQNLSPFTLEVSTTDEENSGDLLLPHQTYFFNAAPIYMRCIDGTAKTRVITAGVNPCELSGLNSDCCCSGRAAVAAGLTTRLSTIPTSPTFFHLQEMMIKMSVSKATVIDALGWFKDLITAEVQESIDAIEPYSLPTASRWQKGGVMIGQDSGLEMSGDYLLVTLPTASTSVKGCVKVGGGLSMSGDTLNVTLENYTLPTASTTEKGGVVIGTGLSMAGDTLNCTVSSGTLDLVTQTDNGLMRATDKVKLDGIANGAQANVIENISIDGTPQLITANKTAQLDLSAYIKKTEIASGVRMKGSVNSFTDLPATAEVGDLYNVKTAGGVDGDGTPIEAGDNVVYTDKGTWDVMAGFIDLSDYAKLTDLTGAMSAIYSLSSTVKNFHNYTLPTASATEKGGVMIGNGLSMAGDTLNVTVESYTLPTASTTEKGGVIIGAGLSMAGDTLNVTLEAETYDDFTGATSITGGQSGLVPQPKAGDQKNFLCGDGTWADPSRFVHVVIGNGGSATAASSSVSTIQGGLWQDLIDGVPVLKLRYGDYEYNFNYDTSNRNGDGTTPLDTTTKGVEYILTTVPSSQDGELWYEVANNVPTLKVHKWVFDYGYNYDTITYKGSNANLYSYMPLESTTADALGNIAWTATGTPTIEKSPAGINALRNTGIVKSSFNNAQIAPVYTIDFWFYTDVDKLPEDGTAYKFLELGLTNSAKSNPVTANLSVKNKQFVIGSMLVDIPKSRTHFAFIKAANNDACLIYLNGKMILSWNIKNNSITNPTTRNLYAVTLFPSFSADYPAYIDHFRIFKGQVFWLGDFTPPVPEDYLT